MVQAILLAGATAILSLTGEQIRNTRRLKNALNAESECKVSKMIV